MNRIFVVLIMVLGLGLVGAAAQADTCDFDANGGSSGDWDVAVNWNCVSGGEQVPTFADRAVIVSGKTCNIDSAAVADTLDVENTATLNIEAASGNSLTLDGDDNSGISTIAGTLNLQGSNSVLAFKDNSQTIDGAGKIVGQHNLARITAGSGIQLTNDTTIEGKLTITGLGNFINSSLVHANVAGTLKISPGTFDDDSGGEWRVSTNSSAILRIDPASASAAALEGAFTVSRGTMDVDSPGFETSGRLTFDGGTIDCSGLAANEEAKFTG